MPRHTMRTPTEFPPPPYTDVEYAIAQKYRCPKQVGRLIWTTRIYSRRPDQNPEYTGRTCRICNCCLQLKDKVVYLDPHPESFCHVPVPFRMEFLDLKNGEQSCLVCGLEKSGDPHEQCRKEGGYCAECHSNQLFPYPPHKPWTGYCELAEAAQRNDTVFPPKGPPEDAGGRLVAQMKHDSDATDEWAEVYRRPRRRLEFDDNGQAQTTKASVAQAQAQSTIDTEVKTTVEAGESAQTAEDHPVARHAQEGAQDAIESESRSDAASEPAADKGHNMVEQIVEQIGEQIGEQISEQINEQTAQPSTKETHQKAIQTIGDASGAGRSDLEQINEELQALRHQLDGVMMRLAKILE